MGDREETGIYNASSNYRVVFTARSKELKFPISISLAEFQMYGNVETLSHGNGIDDMARPNLEKMSLKQLLELEAQVQSAIASVRERERGEVKKAMAELAEKHGFKLQELMGGRGKGKITAPKYANPEDPSQTWTGRGRKPNWLVAKLKKGAKMEAFAI